MQKKAVLIIEDQNSMAKFLQDKISNKTDLPVLVAHSLEETQRILDSDYKIVACLTDLNLPDAKEGETVPLLQQKHITTVVFTANYSEQTRKKMFDMQVADYVIKDGPAALDYAANILLQMIDNLEKVVWLLSQPGNQANDIRRLLNNQGYRVFVFESLVEVSGAIRGKGPDMLLINQVDKYSAKDSLALIQLVRFYYTSSQLPIILADYTANSRQCIKLMKYGVNDFFHLESSIEEFYIRVRLNLLQAERFKQIEKISHTDSLTGLFNRGYFFEHAQRYFEQDSDDNPDERGQETCFAVMIDIDLFKNINDIYGHDKGDKAIQYCADAIKNNFNEFLVGRFGGEEFCVAGKVSDINYIEELSEKLRAEVEQESAIKTEVGFTISIGLSQNAQNLDKALLIADEALYEAKESGRNQVVIF